MKPYEQEGRDESPASESGKTEAYEHHVRYEQQHNVHNGAGVGTKTFQSNSPELHGGAPTTIGRTDHEGT